MWQSLADHLSNPSHNQLTKLLEKCMELEKPEEQLCELIRQRIVLLFRERYSISNCTNVLLMNVYLKICFNLPEQTDTPLRCLQKIIVESTDEFYNNFDLIIEVLFYALPYWPGEESDILIELKKFGLQSSNDRIRRGCFRIIDRYSYAFTFRLESLLFTPEELIDLHELCYHRDYELREVCLGIFISYMAKAFHSSAEDVLKGLERYMPMIEYKTDANMVHIIQQAILSDTKYPNDTSIECTSMYRNFITSEYMVESILIYDQESHNTLALLLNKQSDIGLPENFQISDYEYIFDDKDDSVIEMAAKENGLDNIFQVSEIESRLKRIRYIENQDKDFEFMPYLYRLPH